MFFSSLTFLWYLRIVHSYTFSHSHRPWPLFNGNYLNTICILVYIMQIVCWNLRVCWLKKKFPFRVRVRLHFRFSSKTRVCECFRTFNTCMVHKPRTMSKNHSIWCLPLYHTKLSIYIEFASLEPPVNSGWSIYCRRTIWKVIFSYIFLLRFM